jgi:hypothetical protein
MILPDTTENPGPELRAGYPRRIKSGAFFREYAPAEQPDPDRGAQPNITRILFKASPCPLSAQRTRKTDAENPQVNR